MADKNSKTSSSSAQQSRLQRRRPASLQICPASSTFWNAPIPLLSPLETSPTAVEIARSRDEQNNQKSNQQQQQQQQRGGGGSGEKAVVFKKWQHPAAPFCYEPPKLKPSFFVPV